MHAECFPNGWYFWGMPILWRMPSELPFMVLNIRDSIRIQGCDLARWKLSKYIKITRHVINRILGNFCGV